MRKAIVGIVAVCLLAVPVVPALAGSSAVYPPDAAPAGMNHRHWLGSYMTWLIEIPSPENPAVDPSSPRNCEPVGGAIFLGPSGANCAVPAGTPAVFSTFGWECSTAEGLGESYFKLRRCAKRHFRHDFDPDIFRQRILIDGERVPRNRRWITRSPGEIIDFPDENLWGGTPGPSKSFTKGWLFILRPLDPGLHTIRVRARDEQYGPFRFIYKLHVS